MSSYKIYLKNRDGAIVGSGAFDADDHDGAIRFARARSATWPPSCHSYEILLESRVIHSENLSRDKETEKHD